MVQKSRTGKKKHNPYQGKQAQNVVAQGAKKEDPNQKMIKKINRGWLVLAAVYFVCMFVSWDMDHASLGYKIVQIACYGALLLWGVLLMVTSKYYVQKGSATMNKIFGAVLIFLSVIQLSATISGQV